MADLVCASFIPSPPSFHTLSKQRSLEPNSVVAARVRVRSQTSYLSRLAVVYAHPLRLKIVTELCMQEWENEIEEEFGDELTPEEWDEIEQEYIENRETCFVPLLPPPSTIGDGTVFGDKEFAPLHLMTKTNAQG